MANFSWTEFWDHAPGMIMMLCIFGGSAITGIIALVVNGWKHNREHERISILKQQMIDKGMSADDIIRVIQAEPPQSKPEE